MFLLFPEMNKIIPNCANLNHPLSIQSGIDYPELFNKWEKIDNPDGSFYLSFADIQQDDDNFGNPIGEPKNVRYYLQNLGKDYPGLGDKPRDKFIQKDNTFVHYIDNKITNYTLNIFYNYLSDRDTQNFTEEQRKSTVIQLVNELPDLIV
jgi:hypothetical protein